MSSFPSTQRYTCDAKSSHQPQWTDLFCPVWKIYTTWSQGSITTKGRWQFRPAKRIPLSIGSCRPSPLRCTNITLTTNKAQNKEGRKGVCTCLWVLLARVTLNIYHSTNTTHKCVNWNDEPSQMSVLQWKTLDVLVGYPGNARPKQASVAMQLMHKRCINHHICIFVTCVRWKITSLFDSI